MAGVRNAESAGDAPGDPAKGLELQGEGAYYGKLSTASDVDWFRESNVTTDAACVLLTSYATTWTEATLATAGPTAHSVTTPIPPWTEAAPRVGLATRDATHALVGMGAIPDPYSGTAATGGHYGFELALLDRSELGEGDGATGRDAGPTPAESEAAQGVCTGGTLSGILDLADVYSFTVEAGQQIVYSLAATSSSNIRLEILDAMGRQAATPALDGEIGTVVLPEAGTYFASVSMSGASPVEYVLALTGPDPPPGSPCRPTCHVS